MLPDDVASQLAEALEPFGFEAQPERQAFVRSATDDDNEWRETNETALANLDAWVADLGIGARREGASWRGNARKDGDSFALSFHPQGIKDFVTGEGYSPIDIVAKVASVEPCEAMRMLRKQLGLYVEPELPRVHFTFRKGSVWPVLARDASEADRGQEEPPPQLADEPEAAEPEAGRSSGKRGKADPLDAITLGRDVDWTAPVGLMGQMSKWMDATAQCANAPLSVTGAESIIAAIAGHANLYGPTRLQSSIYAIMAGVTTIGKESVLASVKKILTAAIPLRIWTSDAYSLAAIDGLIVDRPALLMVVDEITKTLFARILSSRANEHAEGLLGFLIQAFTLTMGTDYVSTNRSPKSVIQSVTVPSLQVSLLGGCRPDDLFKVLQAGNVSDGFLNRLTVVEAGPRVINDDPLVGGVPSSFIDDLRSIVIANRRADGNVLALIRHPVSRMIPWASDDVRRAWTDFRNLTFGIIELGATGGGRDLRPLGRKDPTRRAASCALPHGR